MVIKKFGFFKDLIYCFSFLFIFSFSIYSIFGTGGSEIFSNDNFKINEDGDNLKFINIENIINSTNSGVSFALEFNSKISNEDIFKVNIYNISGENEKSDLDYNLISSNCLQKLNRDESVAYRKIMCDINFSSISGEVLILGLIEDKDGNIIDKSYFTILINNNLISSFISKDNYTQIKILVSNKNDNFKDNKILNYIPKSVIKEINESNKNYLIFDNNYNYTIIKSDPLIAWNIEKNPTEINYKIRENNISRIEIKKFKVETSSADLNKNQYLKYIVIFLIVLIILLLIKPIFSKK